MEGRLEKLEKNSERILALVNRLAQDRGTEIASDEVLPSSKVRRSEKVNLRGNDRISRMDPQNSAGTGQTFFGNGYEGMRNSYIFDIEEDILGSFSKIQQDSSVDEYLLRFDELKTSILAIENWSLSEEFLIDKFINGLKHDVKNFMKWFCPYISLSQAIDVARLHERYLGKKNIENGDEDVVDQLKKLVQTGNVDEYETKFENLKSLVFAANRGLSESYLVSCFISGLKPRIAHLVKMYKPQSLSDAISLARLQEMCCLVEEDANNNGKTLAIIENVEKQPEIQTDIHELDEKPVNEDLLLKDLEDDVDYDNVCDSLFEIEKMNFMRQPSPIQNSSDETYNAENEELGMRSGDVARFIPNKEIGGVQHCFEIDVQHVESEEQNEENVVTTMSDPTEECTTFVVEESEEQNEENEIVDFQKELELDTQNVKKRKEDWNKDLSEGWKLVEIEYVKPMNLKLEDPFCVLIDSVRFGGKTQLFLAAEFDSYMVGIKCLLVIRCEVYIMLMRSLPRCDEEMELPWLRKGVG